MREGISIKDYVIIMENHEINKKPIYSAVKQMRRSIMKNEYDNNRSIVIRGLVGKLRYD